MNYTYNPNGSLTNAANDTFVKATYHKHSCLPLQITGSGGSVSLCYDSMGRRAIKKGAVNVSYHRGVDGGVMPLSEIVNGEEVVYIETPSGYRLSRSSKVYYIHSLDHLGSVRMRSNAADCISAMYSAYGEAIMTTRTTPLRYTFTGYELDSETNLMNAWRRIYSPKLARFVMVDSKLQYASPYLYCNGDPFNHTDPTGEISSAFISGIIAAAVLILSIIAVVATTGTATPLVTETDLAAGEGLGESATQAVITNAAEHGAEDAAAEASAMPTTKLGYAVWGGVIGAASTAVSNGAQLATKAASGEHIKVWQAVKTMLIEPAIGFVSGFAGGFITGAGILAFRQAAFTISSYMAGAAITSVSQSLLTAAAEREKIDGASLGITLGVAVVESLMLVPQFTAVHPMMRRSIISVRNVDGMTPEEIFLSPIVSRPTNLKTELSIIRHTSRLQRQRMTNGKLSLTHKRLLARRRGLYRFQTVMGAPFVRRPVAPPPDPA